MAKNSVHRSSHKDGMPAEIPAMIAISALVVLLVFIAMFSYLVSSMDDGSLTTAAQASEGACRTGAFDDPPVPDESYYWYRFCDISCKDNSDCPQSEDPNVYKQTSNWCYSGRCIALYSKGATPGSGNSSGGGERERDDDDGGGGTTPPRQGGEPAVEPCTAYTIPSEGQTTRAQFEESDTYLLSADEYLWKLASTASCSGNDACAQGSMPGWCFGFAEGDSCLIYEKPKPDDCSVKVAQVQQPPTPIPPPPSDNGGSQPRPTQANGSNGGSSGRSGSTGQNQPSPGSGSEEDHEDLCMVTVTLRNAETERTVEIQEISLSQGNITEKRSGIASSTYQSQTQFTASELITVTVSDDQGNQLRNVRRTLTKSSSGWCAVPLEIRQESTEPDREPTVGENEPERDLTPTARVDTTCRQVEVTVADLNEEADVLFSVNLYEYQVNGERSKIDDKVVNQNTNIATFYLSEEIPSSKLFARIRTAGYSGQSTIIRNCRGNITVRTPANEEPTTSPEPTPEANDPGQIQTGVTIRNLLEGPVYLSKICYQDKARVVGAGYRCTFIKKIYGSGGKWSDPDLLKQFCLNDGSRADAIQVYVSYNVIPESLQTDGFIDRSKLIEDIREGRFTMRLSGINEVACGQQATIEFDN